MKTLLLGALLLGALPFTAAAQAADTGPVITLDQSPPDLATVQTPVVLAVADQAAVDTAGIELVTATAEAFGVPAATSAVALVASYRAVFDVGRQPDGRLPARSDAFTLRLDNLTRDVERLALRSDFCLAALADRQRGAPPNTALGSARPPGY